jgi:tRNA nucleotidyltransferase (CCA-adding enzyme)
MKTAIEQLKGIFPEDTHQRVFLVGGAVRDMLLGQEHNDIDLAAALAPGEFTALGFRLVEGRSTAPIWHLHVEGLGTIEVTPLADSAELADDLRKRDFTINALAMTLAGNIIDPLGGRDDLEHKRLAPCSRRTFIDDPLRVFRAFRFAADGWHMTPACEELLRERNWDQELSSIPVERFSREMLKALETPEPERFFQLMLEMDAGQGYLPELFRMPHVPAGPLEHHPEGDLFSHSIQVLQRTAVQSHNPLARFCAFFHDLGKLSTDPSLYPRHHGHDQAGFVSADVFCRRLRLPASYGKALAMVSRLHGTFNLWAQLRDSTKLEVAGQALKAGIADILPLVSAADKAGGREPGEWRAALRIAALSSAELGIEPQTLERMQPSTRTGLILQKRVEQFRATLTTSP